MGYPNEERKGRLPRVVVIGGGVTGTRTANLLVQMVQGQAVVQLITASPFHVYSPGLLHVPFEDVQQIDTVRLEAELLRPELAVAAETPATRIDRSGRTVTIAGGHRLPFDYLVLATGTEPDAERVPGLAAAAHHFGTHSDALRLREALQEFTRGRIVVGLAEAHHSSPTAPIEFACLLVDYLRRWGRDRHAQILVTVPSESLFPDVVIAARLAAWLGKLGIPTRAGLVPAQVIDQSLVGQDGRRVPFDLLVMEPPQRGVAAIRDSGLGNRQGLIECEPSTLRVRGEGDLWAIGTCSSLEVGRWAIAGVHQAVMVAEDIAARVQGRPAPRPYTGRAEIFMEMGRGRVALVTHSFGAPYRFHAPSPITATGKRAFDWAYWTLAPTGFVLAPRHRRPLSPDTRP